MDIAYDHIQEDVYNKGNASNKPEAADSQKEKQQEAQASLNEDIQEAYKAISTSAWGAKIGGFFGTVVKQGESVYQTAQKELSAAGGEATRGLSDLRETIISHTRTLSMTSPTTATATATATANPDESPTPTAASFSSQDKSIDSAAKDSDLISRLKQEAAKRLKDIQRAEDAADAALLQFGSSVRDFLKEAITVAPPMAGGVNAGARDGATFESKDAAGKRVIHSTRFEAQLHVLHTNPETLLKAPEHSGLFAEWKGEFDVEGKTEDIAVDLKEYSELRSTMEKLVPEKIPYSEFWCRYYFLRHSIETAENRRKELLKAAAANDDVSGWGDDSDDESAGETPAKKDKKVKKIKNTDSSSDEEEEDDDDDDDDDDEDDEDGDSDEEKFKGKAVPKRPVSAGSSRTIQVKKVAEGRKSNEGDSDTSYDVVGAASGMPSQAPSKASKEDDDGSEQESSEEEDWE